MDPENLIGQICRRLTGCFHTFRRTQSLHVELYNMCGVTQMLFLIKEFFQAIQHLCCNQKIFMLRMFREPLYRIGTGEFCFFSIFFQFSRKSFHQFSCCSLPTKVRIHNSMCHIDPACTCFRKIYVCFHIAGFIFKPDFIFSIF